MKNENTIYQNLWYAMKAILKGRFRAMNVCIYKPEWSQIITLMMHHKVLQKQEEAKPKISKTK
jgi:hypothetical protein